VVGRPVVTIDRDFPVWFPCGILDRDVEAAYCGLLEHVASGPTEPWPEVHRTAVLWRFGGIAEALADVDDLPSSKRHLNAMLTESLPYAYRLMTAEEWGKRFRGHRNALTHVRLDNGQSFTSALAEHQDTNHVLDYLRLASFYVAANISAGLSEISPETVKRWVDIAGQDYAWAASIT